MALDLRTVPRLSARPFQLILRSRKTQPSRSAHIALDLRTFPRIVSVYKGLVIAPAPALSLVRMTDAMRRRLSLEWPPLTDVMRRWCGLEWSLLAFADEIGTCGSSVSETSAGFDITRNPDERYLPLLAR